MTDTKRPQITGCVDGSFRDRIAAAIAGVDDWCGVTDPAILADAVMELFTEECRNGAIVGSRDMLARTGYKTARHRWVTEWEKDE